MLRVRTDQRTSESDGVWCDQSGLGRASKAASQPVSGILRN